MWDWLCHSYKLRCRDATIGGTRAGDSWIFSVSVEEISTTQAAIMQLSPSSTGFISQMWLQQLGEKAVLPGDMLIAINQKKPFRQDWHWTRLPIPLVLKGCLLRKDIPVEVSATIEEDPRSGLKPVPIRQMCLKINGHVLSIVVVDWS